MLQMLNRVALVFSVGTLASFTAHAVLLAVLVFGLPELRLEPEEPETIQVELELPPPPTSEEEEPEVEPSQSQEAAAPPPEPAVDEEVEGEQTPEAEQTPPAPPQIFRPVFRFGEEDAGPKQPADSEGPDERQTAESANPDDPSDAAETPQEDLAALQSTSPEAVPVPAAKPESSEIEEAAPPSATSQENEATVATVAIGDIPRGIRAGELCVSELRSQLRGSIPPFWPDLLPTYRLDEGNVLQVRRGAFRQGARWYNLQFRCEVDDEATRILSFEFEVGAPVPRSEWAVRGLPAS